MVNSKLWIWPVIIVIGVFGWLLLGRLTKNTSTTSSTPAVSVSVPTSAPHQQTQAGIPRRLIIPKLGIDTAVEQVGLDSQGRMDIPSNNVDVAWYKLGYKPGEKGGAVIDGHLDTVTGAPAVFYYLANLQKGDQIMVTNDQGKTLTFVVTDNISYPFDRVPLNRVFGPADKPMLNLITCVGIWDQADRNYSNRQVVYSELVS